MLMDIGMNETCTSWIEFSDALRFMTDLVSRLIAVQLDREESTEYYATIGHSCLMRGETLIFLFLFFIYHIPAILNSHQNISYV